MSPALSRIAGIFGEGLLILLGLLVATAALSHLGLVLTRGRPRMRVAVLSALLVAYHAAAFQLLSQIQVQLLGFVFVFFHLGFVFRFLSSIYYHRRGGPAPGFLFHVALLVGGPRQHYGAGRWNDLRGRRLDKTFVRQLAVHTGYSLAVLLGVGGLVALAIADPSLPLRAVLIRGGLFLMALEGLAVLANLQGTCWAVAGLWPNPFFGNFTWLRSRHIGQFWQNWNRPAVEAFRELSQALGLRRRYVLNTLVVFAASGLLHQVMVYYYTRHLSYGTLLSFLIHAVLVALFTRLWHRRRKLPGWLRVAVFNPLTTAFVVILASQPFVLDFYGRFRIP